MEALTIIIYGIICCFAGMVVSHFYTKAKTTLNFKAKLKKYFKDHKSIGYQKVKNLIDD